MSRKTKGHLLSLTGYLFLIFTILGMIKSFTADEQLYAGLLWLFGLPIGLCLTWFGSSYITGKIVKINTENIFIAYGIRKKETYRILFSDISEIEAKYTAGRNVYILELEITEIKSSPPNSKKRTEFRIVETIKEPGGKIKILQILNDLATKCKVYTTKWWPWKGWPWPIDRQIWTPVNIDVPDKK